jgi:putative DNA primase/helicase
MRQGRLAPLFQNIPNQLKARDQWVLWRYEFRRGNLTKVSYAVDRRRASVADPSTCHSYEEVVRVFEGTKDFFDGIGYVLAAHDPFTGIDLDHCIENELLQEWAAIHRKIREQLL